MAQKQKSILIIGSGPTVIGHGTEYSRAAWKACGLFKEAGCKVIVLDSNPASLALETDVADRVYLEPLMPDVVQKILDIEKPDMVFPIAGGQNALNLCVQLADELSKRSIEVMGIKPDAIESVGDRLRFAELVKKSGGYALPSMCAKTREEAAAAAQQLGLPVVLRPYYQVAGTGSAVAYNLEELKEAAYGAIRQSPAGATLVEKAVLGWKEATCPVFRDCKGDSIVPGIIEDIEPMGVHSGDSVAVYPAQTLLPGQAAAMIDIAKKLADAVGLVGPADVEFAINPADHQEIAVIEFNPGITRFSAGISFATGLMLVEVAVQLALGKPVSDVCPEQPQPKAVAVRAPRFCFEKFPAAKPELSTTMKSIGEIYGLGETFREAFQKALRAPVGSYDDFRFDEALDLDANTLNALLSQPHPHRYLTIRAALEQGMSPGRISETTGISEFFINEIKELVDTAKSLATKELDSELLLSAKSQGFSDAQISALTGRSVDAIAGLREGLGILPRYVWVNDVIRYASYGTKASAGKKIDKSLILMIGPGPNAIGTGSEFEFSVSKAANAFRELGYAVSCVNCSIQGPSSNPVLWDELFVIPLCIEEVLDVAKAVKPDAISVQFGGPVALQLAEALEERGYRILGTAPDNIKRASGRHTRKSLLSKLGMLQPKDAVVTTSKEAPAAAERIGYPVVIRPLQPVAGKTMDVVFNQEDLDQSVKQFIGLGCCDGNGSPLLVAEFLEDAIEIEIDAVSDGTTLLICGLMEHIEEAGIHSGDSASSLPPYTLTGSVIERVRQHARAIASELNVNGLLNLQFAIKNDLIYVTEIMPSASLTLPFVTLATGLPIVEIATRVLAGISLKRQHATREPAPKKMAIRDAVFPFAHFPGVDAVLGPDMKSTGQVMAISDTFGLAFAKTFVGSGQRLPLGGKIFMSLKNKDKRPMLVVARKLDELGFKLIATRGTAAVLERNGVAVERISKISEGRPNIVDLIKNGEIGLIINTPNRKTPSIDEVAIRANAVANNVPLITTAWGASAALIAIETIIRHGFEVAPLK